MRFRFSLCLLITCTLSLAGRGRTDGAAGPAASAPASQPSESPHARTIVSRHVGPDGTVVAQLDNGMAAVVKATRTSPVVCVRAFVRAGSIYEARWLGAGISHLVEHLVAKGAVHAPAGGGTAQTPKPTGTRVDEIGGQSNAETSLDQTCYYISASSSKVMDCIDVIADWLARPDITEADFKREHGVVRRELETGLGDPHRHLWQAHAADLFRDHPAAVPVIGFRKPLSELTYQDVLAYHARMYVPQNMILAVVGDVDVEAVLARICKALGGFDKSRSPVLDPGPVPQVSSTRRNTYSHKGLDGTMAYVSFRTVDLMDEDLYALDVLAYVLATGRASRLVDKIQRQQKLVTLIFAGSWTPPWGAGMFTIGFRADPDKAQRAEEAVLEELQAVVRDGVTPEELIRAKRQKVADHVYSQQTAESQAATLGGDYMSTGDAWFSSHYTKRIQLVTAEQVQAAARKYFGLDRMVITYLVSPDRMEAEAAKAKSRQEAQAVAFTLPNGLRVVLGPNDAVQLASMTFVTHGGLLLEAPKTNGMGTLMTALSTRGAGKYSAQDIDTFFDKAGGAIFGKCGNNTFHWQANVLADSVPEALAILAAVIQKPTFSPDELAILRPMLLSEIRQIDEDWYPQLNRFFREKFFTGSPYAMQPSGSQQVVQNATVQQIAAYHAKTVKASQGVLAIYGRFDPKAVREQIERLFADMPKGALDIPSPAARKVAPGGELYVLPTKNPEVAGIMVGVPGMKLSDLQDRLAVNVLDTIISGYKLPSGWLHNELRGKELVYVVHAHNWSGVAPGAFVTYAACRPDKAPEVVAIIRKNLHRAADYTPTPQEVRKAVNSILTAELLESQSMAELSMAAALDELYGFGYNFRSRLEGLYNRITPQDVLRVGRKYLSSSLVVTVATPKPGLFPQASSQPSGGKDQSGK